MSVEKRATSRDHIAVLIEHPGWREAVPDIEAVAIAAARCAVAGTPCENDEINLLLAGDAELRQLNHRFRGRDKATNVLSFPAAGLVGRGRSLGDIALAFETVALEAQQQSKPFAYHAQHLIVHGVLHLMGFDHETEPDAATMEAREIELLAKLGIPDPYRAAGD
jgi:probable rRNA maturation factor